MTLKMFLIIEVLVFVALLTISTTIKREGGVTNVKLSDTAINMLETQKRQHEYILFMQGVCGQKPILADTIKPHQKN